MLLEILSQGCTLKMNLITLFWVTGQSMLKFFVYSTIPRRSGIVEKIVNGRTSDLS